MNEEKIEQAVLRYLSSENKDEYGQQRYLTTIFDKVVVPSLPNADGYENEDFDQLKHELSVILDQMVADGLLESRWGERDYEASYRLTDQGTYEASGFNVLVTEDGDSIVAEDGDFIVTNGQDGASKDRPITVDSSTWTGLTRTKIDARNAGIVSTLIGQALDSLSASEIGNFETMQATAYLKAARELGDAPEPPSEEIWRLISRAADVAGLAALFFTIFTQALT